MKNRSGKSRSEDPIAVGGPGAGRRTRTRSEDPPARVPPGWYEVLDAAKGIAAVSLRGIPADSPLIKLILRMRRALRQDP